MVEHALTTAEMGCSNLPVILAPQVLEVETKGLDGQHPLKSHTEASLGYIAGPVSSAEGRQLQEGSMTDFCFDFGNDFSEE